MVVWQDSRSLINTYSSYSMHNFELLKACINASVFKICPSHFHIFTTILKAGLPIVCEIFWAPLGTQVNTIASYKTDEQYAIWHEHILDILKTGGGSEREHAVVSQIKIRISEYSLSTVQNKKNASSKSQ